MIHPDLKLLRDETAEFCRRHHIKTLSLVGSATRGDFRPDSDVDFLTEFDPEVSIGLAEYLDMEEKLAGIVGRPVDLIERKTIEQSRNYIRSNHILSNLEPVYLEPRKPVSDSLGTGKSRVGEPRQATPCIGTAALG